MAKNIYEKIRDLVRDAGFVEKDGKMNFGEKYRYHKAEDITSHVRPHLFNHGLVVNPVDITVFKDQYIDPNPRDGKGDFLKPKETKGLQNHVAIMVTWEVVNTDDMIERIVIKTVGAGQDTGDKAFSKAQTAATKYMYFQLCKISDQEDDPDAYNEDNPDMRDEDVDKLIAKQEEPEIPFPEEGVEEDPDADFEDDEPPLTDKLKEKTKEHDKEVKSSKDAASELSAYFKSKGVKKKSQVDEIFRILKIKDKWNDSKLGQIFDPKKKQALDKAIETIVNIPY